MKPNKMKHHFDAKHPNFAGKDVQYFKNKADSVKKNRLDFRGKYQQQNMAAIEASYLVALRIAKAKKPHTIAEELLLPATKDIVRVCLELNTLTNSIQYFCLITPSVEEYTTCLLILWSK